MPKENLSGNANIAFDGEEVKLFFNFVTKLTE